MDLEASDQKIFSREFVFPGLAFTFATQGAIFPVFKKAHDPKFSSYCMVVARYAKSREQPRYVYYEEIV
ncbi:hypothetical protein [Pontibacter sp. HSC-36F09]|uniref:hypothetical protein n=1 Tax=Pontibacter sp. HSC-36F09 TaxID=2910966 RepID=UPI00209C7DC0|nr:hypothetical protein [Pontibacter sp. HSC-36F09]MCP2045014.1 hypothetical protein [Pontibacter sp. HSC-36F09]